MTALSISAASVLLVSGTPLTDQVAGEAFIAGAYVYRKSTDGKWYKAQCDGTVDEAGATDCGMALATADAVGARIDVATHAGSCIVSVGAGAAGAVYMIAAAAGSITPVADLVTSNKATVAALGIGSNKLRLARLYDAGAVVP